MTDSTGGIVAYGAVDPLAMGSQLGLSAVRFGWFYALNQLLDREARRLGQRPGYQPKRPVPTRQELMAALGALLLEDARAVGRGVHPPAQSDARDFGGAFGRVREMLADFRSALQRREAADASSARSEAGATSLPDYYVQDFHFQTGGYLSEQSARLYDIQIETLFYGAAQAMRRATLAPIAAEIAGRDQRKLALLDVACGTGRLLRDVRLAWPALQLSGLDLSPAYLAEAKRHMGALRPVAFIEGNAEEIPLADASIDIVTSVFLFHELPPEVRRPVAREMARVLKPGGLLVFVDSMQMGDRPGWDGLLEAFPVRFHEPYFRSYAIDDLDGVFSAVGLHAEDQRLAFLSKVLMRRKLG